MHTFVPREKDNRCNYTMEQNKTNRSHSKNTMWERVWTWGLAALTSTESLLREFEAGVHNALFLFSHVIINVGWNSQCLSSVCFFFHFGTIFHPCACCSADTQTKTHLSPLCAHFTSFHWKWIRRALFRHTTLYGTSAKFTADEVGSIRATFWRLQHSKTRRGRPIDFATFPWENVFWHLMRMTHADWNVSFSRPTYKYIIETVSCFEFVKIMLMHRARAYTNSHWDRMHIYISYALIWQSARSFFSLSFYLNKWFAVWRTIELLENEIFNIKLNKHNRRDTKRENAVCQVYSFQWLLKSICRAIIQIQHSANRALVFWQNCILFVGVVGNTNKCEMISLQCIAMSELFHRLLFGGLAIILKCITDGDLPRMAIVQHRKQDATENREKEYKTNNGMKLCGCRN